MSDQHIDKVVIAVSKQDPQAQEFIRAVYGKLTPDEKNAFRKANAADAAKLDIAVTLANEVAKDGHQLTDIEKNQLKEGFRAASAFLKAKAQPKDQQISAETPAANAPIASTQEKKGEEKNPDSSSTKPNDPTTPTKVAAEVTGKDTQKPIDESKPTEKSEGTNKPQDTITKLNKAIDEAMDAWINEKDPEKQKLLKTRLDALQAERKEEETRLAAATRRDDQEEKAEQRAAEAAARKDELEQKAEDRKKEQEARDAEKRIRDEVTFKESETRKLSNLITTNRDVRDAERGTLLSPVSEVKRDLMRSEATKIGVPYDKKDSWEEIFKKIIDKKVLDRFPPQTKADGTVQEPNEE